MAEKKQRFILGLDLLGRLSPAKRRFARGLVATVLSSLIVYLANSGLPMLAEYVASYELEVSDQVLQALIVFLPPLLMSASKKLRESKNLYLPI